MKRTLFSVFFAIFAVAIFAQTPEAYFPAQHGYITADSGRWTLIDDTGSAVYAVIAPKDPTVLVSYTIKRNWGGYITGAVAFQTNCFTISSDQNPIPPSCLLDRLVSELTARNLLKGANLAKPYRDYVEVTGWTILNRDIVLSTKDSRWNETVKE